MLSRIPSVIGVPVFTDRVTAHMDAFARICVEITVGDDLPKTILMENDKGEVTELKVI